jgi:hypothetical protein
MGRFREPSVWLLIAAACLSLRIWVLGVNIFNDSYQYLSMAHNIATGRGISTSIPYYETELHYGVIPAPETHFPPGFPLLVAALSAMGLGGETSAYAVSFLAFVAMVPLVLLLARRVGIDRGAARLAVALVCLNQALLVSSASLGSEPAFTALTIAALLFVQRSQAEEGGSLGAAALGGALAAGAYWIRYAGLLLVATLALLCVLRWMQSRRPQLVRAAVALGTAVFGAAPLLVRNEMLVGSWKGYVTKHMFRPAGIGKAYIVSMYHAGFGEGLLRKTGPLAAVCTLCAVALAVAAVRRPGSHRPVAVSVPALFAGVYTVGMIYLGVTSDIGFGTRMFIPLLPVLAILGAAAFTRWRPALGRRTLIAAASIMVVAYAACNAIGSSLTVAFAPHLRVRSAVAGELRRILDADQSVLVSADAQAAAYGLGRPVVGLVGDDYGSLRWTEREVHDLMLRYGSRHLLLFPGTETFDAQQTSQFLRSLAAGQLPTWLRIQAKNDRAILFELTCGPGLPGCAEQSGEHGAAQPVKGRHSATRIRLRRS